MKPIRDIIVKVPQAYENSIKTKSGLILLLDENIKQVKDTIRYGEVVAVPDELPIDVKIGDTLFFHHNIVGVTVMDHGNDDVDSDYIYNRKEHLYRVPVDMSWPLAFATIRDGEFKALDGICFVKPLTKKKYDTTIFIPNNEVLVKQRGTLIHGCKTLSDQGVNEGDGVVFDKDSEYKFKIGDQVLYRMFTDWILGKYED